MEVFGLTHIQTWIVRGCILEHRYYHRAGMNATMTFGGRMALNSMTPGFVIQTG